MSRFGRPFLSEPARLGEEIYRREPFRSTWRMVIPYSRTRRLRGILALRAIPAAERKPLAQVWRGRCEHPHRLLVLRNRHHDLARVQLQARRVGPWHELDLPRAALARLVAVDVVAQDRGTHRGAVHTQLMRAPGDGLEGEPGECLLGGTLAARSDCSPPPAKRWGGVGGGGRFGEHGGEGARGESRHHRPLPHTRLAPW